MTLLDQRILIDAPPQIIWEFVSDPYKLAQWHAGYTSVSVLTTQQTGLGTRRRCAVTGGGKDVIEHITAWVDGLGYEYELLEGGSYRAMRGRIRLQPGPDGTSVQWTVEYQPRGPFGSVRNWLSGRKQFAAMMTASLRELRQQVNALGLRMDDGYRARVGIQGRLNVAERAQYQRRHQVPVGADPASPAPALQEASVADVGELAGTPLPAEEVAARPAAPSASFETASEPKPPADPRQALAAQPDSPVEAPAPLLEAEPQAPAPLAQPGPQDLLPPPPPELIAPPPTSPPPEPQQPIPAPPPDAAEPDYRRVTPPRGIPAVRPPVADVPSPYERPAADKAPSRPTPPRGVPSVAPSGAGGQAQREGVLPPPTPKTDTGEISIWEIFGLRRPSDQDEDALQGLIQSVETRKTLELRRQAFQRGLKHPPRVRLLESASGLRARQGLRRLRVRTHVSQADPGQGNRNENGA